jgi:TolB-like protein/Tfp pilus assembly protein PilF/predicted Ser/Thr protein kinase
MSIAAGQRLGPFEVLARLGAGGMGEVYRARDTRLERTVAIKVLPPELAQSEAYRLRFQREAKAASALSHPNIAHIYDVGEQDGIHFIAMEFVEGENLRAMLARGPLDADRVAEVGIQMASALEEAHRRGIVHRDIKPANAVISAQGQVKVLDFGLARQLQDGGTAIDSAMSTEAHTQAGVVLGTLPYMSPEQALGQPVDPRTDIFSLGVVLYELATGKLPFAGDTANQTIDCICHANPPPITDLSKKAPEALQRIVAKCLEKDRERRYATAKDLQVDLRNLQRDRGSGARVAAPRARGRRVAVTIGLAALVLFGLALRAWLVPSRTSIESIAVLPFQNLTGNPELEYLSTGLTESLINSLAQLPGLKVTSRASAFAFKDGQTELGEIAGKLGVRALLLGRLAQQGKELSLSAELVEPRDRRQLWGERYQLGTDDAPKVEDALARTISRTISPRLSGGSAPEVAEKRIDPEAHRLFLKGRLFLAGTPDELQQATDHFQRALEREPLYAAAHAALAESWATRAFLFSENRDENVRKARASVKRALEISPDQAEPLAVSGMIRLYFDWDLPGAEGDLKRALERNPSSAMAYEEYTNVLTAQGQTEESLEVARRAKELDPLSVLPTHQLGITYMTLGRFEEAAAEFKEAQQIRPTWLWGYIKRGKALAHLGRCPEGLAEEARAEEILGTREHETAWSWIAFVYGKCGRPERGREYLRRLEELERRRFVDPIALAIVHAGLGDEGGALERLEQAYRARSPWMFTVSTFPRFYSLESLAANVKFQELCRRVLPESGAS